MSPVCWNIHVTCLHQMNFKINNIIGLFFVHSKASKFGTFAWKCIIDKSAFVCLVVTLAVDWVLETNYLQFLT